MFFYAFILTFKHIFDKDLGELKKSVKYLSSEEGSGWLLIFDYIVNKKDIREEEFIEVVKEAVGGDKMPTLAERWIQQGEQRGIIYGETKSKQDTIIRLMSLKFSITDSEKEFIKSVTDLDKLDKATEAILSEESKAKLLDLLK
jgi:predicted transposase YdaD